MPTTLGRERPAAAPPGEGHRHAAGPVQIRGVESVDVAVVGAGPFGLSGAAPLAGRARVRTFGEPMRTWRRLMPPDMLLRSDWEHTNLSAPGDAGTLDRFVQETGEP